VSAAREIAARVAACRAKAEALMRDLNALIGELPEWREDAPEGSEEYALMAVRAELEVAVGDVDGAIDYLAPRNDDHDPDCCAHRRLQAFIATNGAPQIA
jgi:hypothetical protein